MQTTLKADFETKGSTDSGNEEDGLTKHHSQTQKEGQDDSELSGMSGTNGLSGFDEVARCPDEYQKGIDSAFEADLSEFGGSIENAMLKTDIGTEISLSPLTEDFSWALKPYGDDRCNGYCNIELSRLSVTGKMWSSGTVILTGGNIDSERGIRAFETIHSSLRASGVRTEWNPVEVSNMVVSFESLTDREQFNLYSISAALGTDCQYEPEQFPGLIRHFDSGECCTLYSTGCGQITGAVSLREALDRREELLSRLDSYGLL